MQIMHEYLKFSGTNNQQKIDRFLIYERGLIFRYIFLLYLKKIGGYYYMNNNL